jgi:PEP-CTERM/exosortase A-associated glycosyltransferase
MKTNRHRILHVLNYSLPYISGYCSRSHYILEAQKSLGMEVAAVTSPRHQKIIPESPAQEEIGGITYYRTSVSDTRRPSIPQALAALRFMKDFKRRILEVAGEFKPTIIHAHSPSLCGIPAGGVAREIGIPLVYEVRALWEDAAVDQNRMQTHSWKYLASRIIETWLLKRAEAVVVLCRPLQGEIGARIGDTAKVHVVPNGVDTDHFKPADRNEALARKLGLEGRIVVGFIGTFFRFEGLDDLVKAWDSVAADFPDARLLLVGYGELMPVLERLRGESSRAGSIILPGRVSHEEILDYYSLMDVLVYPRRKLRLTDLVTPLKPLEAMAMGKAVIASDVGGLREIVGEGEAGLLFRAGDVDDLRAKLALLLGSAEARRDLGGRAREYALRERKWLDIVQIYDGIYTSLAG